jgi:tetratricopeptide (TPR) repeat protein
MTYISQPEVLDRDTLFLLHAIVRQYPYFQAARLLYLRNLYQMHDSSFGEELRHSAIYITDRNVLFRLVEGGHLSNLVTSEEQTDQPFDSNIETGSNTDTLIDQFLSTRDIDKPRSSTIPADATTDYIAYMLQNAPQQPDSDAPVPQLQGHELIDSFIGRRSERIVLKEIPEYVPEVPTEEQNGGNEGYFTETLARIYIKQGRYDKAIEIIRRLNLNYPKKNRYFADQIRFLQKLIINNKNKIE